MFSIQMWHPINYPSWIHRDRYVAQVNRWYLEQAGDGFSPFQRLTNPA